MENFTRNIVGHLKKNTNGASTASHLQKIIEKGLLRRFCSVCDYDENIS